MFGAVSLGGVILLPKGWGFDENGEPTPTLKHECGHSVAQSTYLGPLYLPTVVLGAYVPAIAEELWAGENVGDAVFKGMSDNWIERWAWEAAEELEPRKK